MSDPRLSEEIEKMKGEYEPLLPIERQLIWYTFGAGVILLAALVLISRAFV
jgi:hypothetical protein